MRQETQLADKGRSREGLNTTSQGCATTRQRSDFNRSENEASRCNIKKQWHQPLMKGSTGIVMIRIQAHQGNQSNHDQTVHQKNTSRHTQPPVGPVTRLTYISRNAQGHLANLNAGPLALRVSLYHGMCTISKSYSSRSACQWACLRSSFLGAFQYVRFAWSVRIVNGSLVHARYGRQW